MPNMGGEDLAGMGGLPQTLLLNRPELHPLRLVSEPFKVAPAIGIRVFSSPVDDGFRSFPTTKDRPLPVCNKLGRHHLVVDHHACNIEALADLRCLPNGLLRPGLKGQSLVCFPQVLPCCSNGRVLEDSNQSQKAFTLACVAHCSQLSPIDCCSGKNDRKCK